MLPDCGHHRFRQISDSGRNGKSGGERHRPVHPRSDESAPRKLQGKHIYKCLAFLLQIQFRYAHLPERHIRNVPLHEMQAHNVSLQTPPITKRFHNVLLQLQIRHEYNF